MHGFPSLNYGWTLKNAWSIVQTSLKSFFFFQVYDTADFLQGDLRKTSQHIQLSCKKHLSTTKHLLFKAASLALVSSENLHSLKEESKMSSAGNEDLKKSVVRNCKSLNTSPTSSCTHADLKIQLQQESTKKRTSRRPLPKPLVGTEMLNASYTSATLISGLKRGKNKHLTWRRSSSTFSIESLDIQSSLLQKKPLTKSQKSYLHSSSLSQSWNDLLRMEQHSLTKMKTTTIPSPLILTENPSASGFSQITRSFSESEEESIDMSSKQQSSTQNLSVSDGSVARYSQCSTSDEIKESVKTSLENYEVHVFTVAPSSKLFNLIEQSWIYSLLVSIINHLCV